MKTRRARTRGLVAQQLFAFRARSRSTQHRLDTGDKLGPETSVDKILLATTEQAVQWFDTSMTVAKTQGERLFSELLGEHRSRLKEERERAKYAYDARYQAIGRIGLPAVREHRRKRLNAEHQARMAALDDAEASVPDLNAVMMLRVGSV